MPISWTTGTIPDPEELDGDGNNSGVFSGDGLSASVRLRCDMGDFPAIAYNMLNTPTQWPYPMGEFPPMYCHSINWEKSPKQAGTADGQGFTWGTIDFVAQFRARTFELVEGTPPGGGDETVYYSEEVSSTYEMIALEGEDLYYEENSAAVPSGTHGKLVPGELYSVTYYGLAEGIDISPILGKVNNAEFTSPTTGNVCAAQTLLCVGGNKARQITSGANQGWTQTISFSYRPDTWNKVWVPTTAGGGVWSGILDSIGGTNVLLYATADFSGYLPS